MTVPAVEVRCVVGLEHWCEGVLDEWYLIPDVVGEELSL